MTWLLSYLSGRLGLRRQIPAMPDLRDAPYCGHVIWLLNGLRLCLGSKIEVMMKSIIKVVLSIGLASNTGACGSMSIGDALFDTSAVFIEASEIKRCNEDYKENADRWGYTDCVGE